MNAPWRPRWLWRLSQVLDRGRMPVAILLELVLALAYYVYQGRQLLPNPNRLLMVEGAVALGVVLFAYGWATHLRLLAKNYRYKYAMCPDGVLEVHAERRWRWWRWWLWGTPTPTLLELQQGFVQSLLLVHPSAVSHKVHHIRIASPLFTSARKRNKLKAAIAQALPSVVMLNIGPERLCPLTGIFAWRHIHRRASWIECIVKGSSAQTDGIDVYV